MMILMEHGYILKVIIYFRTAKDNPPVTFSIAACETQNVSVSVLPCFGLSEGSSVTAKGMWSKMVKVLVTCVLVVSR
jgi:hypothetical protein